MQRIDFAFANLDRLHAPRGEVFHLCESGRRVAFPEEASVQHSLGAMTFRIASILP